jgi:hypothetical protein
MADIKKYLDQTGVQTLVEQIKAEDTKVLQKAAEAAEKLGENYDAAGSAATAKTEAIAEAEKKVNALANGAVKANTDAITKLNADDATEGSVDYKVKAVKEALQGNIDTVNGKVTANKTAIDAINNETTGILAQAKADAKSKADAVQANVDKLDGKVGEIPEGAEATTIVDYVDEKVAGANADVTSLTGRVGQNEKDIADIKKDYLKATDKTELEGKITTAQNKADAAQTHSEGVAKNLTKETTERTEADKAQVARIKTLEDKIVGLDGSMHFKGILDALPEDVSTYKAGDVVIIGEKEYVFNGTAFAEFGDVSAEAKRIGTLETEIKTAKTDIAKAKEDITANTTAIGTKADASALADEVKARTDADSAMDTRLKSVEGKLGEGEGSVTEQISTAKQEAIDAAAADATTKANKALTDAKAYADTEDAKIEARVDALEGDTHTHANKEELDKFATGDKAKLDDAVSKSHEHANKAVLDGIDADKVKAWDAAEKNAKDYTNTEVGKDRTRLDAVEAKATSNAEAIATKAAQSDLTAAVERITTAETNIQKNTEAINSFVAMTDTEIKALFGVSAEA